MTTYSAVGITAISGQETQSKISVGNAAQIWTSNGTSSLPAFKGSLSTTDGVAVFDGSTLKTISTVKVDSSGRYINTSQPAFLAYKSATTNNVTGNNTLYTVICNTEVYDQGSNYNNSTGTFTAPVTGRYHFCAYVRLEEVGATSTTTSFRITTSNRTYFLTTDGGGNSETAGNRFQVGGSIYADMDASDTATIGVQVSGKGVDSVDVEGQSTLVTYFSGSLIC